MQELERWLVGLEFTRENNKNKRFLGFFIEYVKGVNGNLDTLNTI